MPAPTTVAGLVIEALHAAGVRQLFGVPGGGGNLDLIEAGGRCGVRFVLAQTETAGALMAGAQAEVTGAPGACLCTLGPGAASIVNGVAHAFLDRIPLLVFTDRHADGAQAYLHQRIDQQALFAPITKKSVVLTPDGAHRILADALTTALTPPAGPVHLDCPSDVMSRAAGDRQPVIGPQRSAAALAPLPVAVARLAAQTRYPMVLAGLGAASTRTAAALRAFCESHNVPAMVTYKGKGVLPDTHPLFAGVFTNGAIERAVLNRADMLVGVGLDPVELLPRAWPFKQPIIYCGPPLSAQSHVPFAAMVVGDAAAAVGRLDEVSWGVAGWNREDVQRAAAAQRDALRLDAAGLAPARAVEMVAREAGARARVTVDAGAHMLPAVSLWPVDEPRQMLISNGLSTMGFAVPAAIGAALADRGRRTVALTGDGGLLMCTGELRTAAREGLPLLIVVLNDASLSLIRIKQDGKGYGSTGVGIGAVDWQAVAAGLGVPAWRGDDETSLAAALEAALAQDGPACVEARINGEPYAAMLKAVRG